MLYEANYVDATEEIWDAYDKSEVKLGFELVRGKPIMDDVYHLVCDVIVRHQDGTFLLMKRSLEKEVLPGCWEPGAGGSALKGESPLEAAKRELLEETGIASSDLQQVYRIMQEETHAIHYGYLCVTDCPKDCIVLQEGETVDYKWISQDEFILFVNSDNCSATQRIRLQDFIKHMK